MRQDARPYAALLLSLLLTPAATAFASSPLPAVSEPVPTAASRQERAPFRIRVLDFHTGRGVPAVELTTTSGRTWVTDSAGMIAFDEPGWMERDVYFHVKSHGYALEPDGFGYTGQRLHPVSGGQVTLELKRTNVAERLYRITGADLYRDSVLLGDTPPLAEPLLNAGVTGQDSVMAIPYRDRLYWFWGDTNRASYPLGNFSVTGATSLLPGRGGLDPEVGVDLTYFVGDDGFARKMCPIAGQPGPVWIDGLVTVNDPQGRERLVAHYARMKSLGEMYEQGFAVYDDELERFVPQVQFPLDAPLWPRSHPFRAVVDCVEYWYFPSPYPLLRVRNTWDAVLDVRQYEAFTCLEAGSRYDRDRPVLDRGVDGVLRYAWKADTSPVGAAEQKELIERGFVREDEALLQLRDVESGAPVQAHSGSVFWNESRQRWVMIAQELWGTSLAGEVWFAEADTPSGPWAYARKIVTHDDYTFYNPTQHPYFDKNGGRAIFFEGTFTKTFSGAPVGVPGYDYNQIMYRLDLTDPRLQLPVAVYEVEHGPEASGDEAYEYLTRPDLEKRELWEEVSRIAFFARPSTEPYHFADRRIEPSSAFDTGSSEDRPLPVQVALYRSRESRRVAVDVGVTSLTRQWESVLRYRLDGEGEDAERVGVVWPAPNARPLLDRGVVASGSRGDG